jgi:hypothetical protein
MAPTSCRTSEAVADRINITIRLWDESNSEIVRDSEFSIKSSSRLAGIFRIFIAREGLFKECFGYFRFAYNSRVLFGDETPQELSISDGDVIDATPNMNGEQFV